MDIQNVVEEGRVEAEVIMTDTVLVTRRSDMPVTDPETGKVTYPTGIIHDGRGRVQSRDTEGQTYSDAGAPILVTAFQAQVPVRVGLQKDDQIKVTASESDPLMVGRTFRVDSVTRKTHATKTRANIEEVS